MFKNHIKTAWRNLLKNKSFSLINVLGLAIGLASCLLLLLYANYHLSWDKRFKDLENIYVIQSNQFSENDVFTYQVSPGPMAKAIEEQVPGVIHALRVNNYFAGGITRYKDNVFRTSGLNADPSFFEVFGYPFIKGNAGTALSAPNNIVITDKFAAKLFGNEDPIGKTVMRNDTVPLVVSAVIESPLPNESFQFDYVLPWHVLENENPWTKDAGWGSNFTDTYVQLRSVNDFKSADGVIRKMIMANQNDYKAEAFIFPLAKNHLYHEFKDGRPTGSGYIVQIRLFIFLAIAILLIACINFMNLSTARSQQRAKEVGILKTIGSGSRALIFKFLGESLLITLFAVVVSIGLLVLCIPYFNRLLGITLNLPFSNIYFCSALLLITLVTALVAGAYPAFYLSSFNPLNILKGMTTIKPGSAVPVRKISVALQFCTAIFLIAATICIYQQVQYIKSKPIGYNADNLIEINLEGDLFKHKEALQNDLVTKNIIISSAQTNISITQGGNNSWGFSWPGKKENEKMLIDLFGAGYDFTNTIGAEIIEGRDFSRTFPADTTGKNILISETAMKMMKLDAPVGSTLKDGDGNQYSIIGVFKDILKGSPYYKKNPMLVWYGKTLPVLTMRLNPAKNIASSVDAINKEIKRLNPSYPPDIKFIADNLKRQYEGEKNLGAIANIFGGLAILLSCLGLLGLSAFAAEQRTKEIGVRKVMGAGVLRLVGLLSKEFLVLVIISSVLILPIAWWYMNKWLQKFDYHFTLTAWPLVAAGSIVLLIAMSTVGYQAIKAATANPVKSLRTE